MKKEKKGFQKQPDGHYQISFVRKVMADKSEEEIREAERTYLNYLSLVRKIVNRQSAEEAQAEGRAYNFLIEDIPPFVWEQDWLLQERI